METATPLLEEIEKQKKKRNKEVKKEAPVKVKKLTKKQQQILELANETILPENYHVVWTEKQLDDMCDLLTLEEYVAVDTETTGINPFVNEIVGFSLWLPKFNCGYYVPLKHVDDIGSSHPPVGGRVGIDYVKCLSKDTVIKKVKPLLEDSKKKLILHNSKFDMHILYNWLGIKITPYFDTMIASALLDENQSKGLKELSGIYLKEPADKFSTLFGK
jgi:DNA polymerase-1